MNNKPSLVVKTLLVIASCKTLDHIKVAERYLSLTTTHFDTKLNFELREELIQKRNQITNN
jgi:hypothetical protein